VCVHTYTLGVRNLLGALHNVNRHASLDSAVVAMTAHAFALDEAVEKDEFVGWVVWNVIRRYVCACTYILGGRVRVQWSERGRERAIANTSDGESVCVRESDKRKYLVVLLKCNEIHVCVGYILDKDQTYLYLYLH